MSVLQASTATEIHTRDDDNVVKGPHDDATETPVFND